MEAQTLAPVQQQAPANLITMQLTEQQATWTTLPVQKNALAADLQRRELVAQGLLKQAEAAGQDWNVIDTNLAAYRKAYSDMVEARKPFTGMIQDRIIAPLMEFEKRVEPKSNAKYNELFNKSVDIRRQENLKAQQANAKNQEEANFKIHFQNEYTRMVGLFESTVRNEYTRIYNSYLNAKVQDPAIQDLKQQLSQIPLPPLNNFNAQYLSGEEMKAIFDTIQKPDWQNIFNDLMAEVDKLFANYSSDLANAAAAIQAQEDALKLAQQKADQKVQEESAMNTLVVKAETPTIEGPSIKKNLQVVKRDGWDWAMAVMANFIPNFNDMQKWIRVSDPANLKIGQMADYLGKLATETGLTYKGLELEEICK